MCQFIAIVLAIVLAIVCVFKLWLWTIIALTAIFGVGAVVIRIGWDWLRIAYFPYVVVAWPLLFSEAHDFYRGKPQEGWIAIYIVMVAFMGIGGILLVLRDD